VVAEKKEKEIVCLPSHAKQNTVQQCAGTNQSWSTEVTKRCHEVLNASSLQFFASVKRFIASLLYFFAVINVLSLHRFPDLPPLP
jgi:hypothetical protein